MTTITTEDILQHAGIKGMKWGVRKQKPVSEIKYDTKDVVIKKGSNVHRMIMKANLEKEKDLSGRAYASYKKEDIEKYRKISKMFGTNFGIDYVDMKFKVTKDMVSPSKKKRVDEFIKMIDSDPKDREAMRKSIRNPILMVPKKHLDNLDNANSADKVYNRFAYALVSNKDLRDPYFKRLEKQGYSMMIDDADVNNKIAKAPIIVFDRKKSLVLSGTTDIGR